MSRFYYVSEHMDSSLLRLLVGNMLGPGFNNMDREDKIDLLEGIDRCISNECKIDYGFFVYEDKEISDEADTLYVGKIENHPNGLSLLFKYFFCKREQYQKYCLNNKENGDYSKEEIMGLEDSYKRYPISGDRLYSYKKDGYNKYLFNYNKADAYIYATEQVGKCLELVDFRDLFRRTSIIDGYLLLFSLKSTFKSKMNVVKKIQNLYSNPRRAQKYIDYWEKKENKYSYEEAMVKYINSYINSEYSSKDDNSILIIIFNDKIWDKLDGNLKIKAIEKMNYYLAEFAKVTPKDIDYSCRNMFDIDSDEIRVGDINNCSGVEILKGLTFFYAGAFVLNDSKQKENGEAIKIFEEGAQHIKRSIENNEAYKLKDYDVVKCLSRIASDMQKVMYDNYKMTELYKVIGVDFDKKKDDINGNVVQMFNKMGGKKHGKTSK